MRPGARIMMRGARPRECRRDGTGRSGGSRPSAEASAPGADVKGTLWGIGIGIGIGGGATAYAGFRRIEEDNKDDINLYLAGMRVTFN